MTQAGHAQRREVPVHIVVTCANRKRHPIPADLRLHTIVQQSATRFTTWTRRLTTSPATAVPADDLYSGEHWQVARMLSDHAAVGNKTVTTWVCSAGYGLVPINAPLRPYAATFGLNHPDSVGDNTESTQRWWNQHAAWPGPVPGSPRSLATLAARDPQANLVVVLSATYLRACAPDLVAALAVLRRAEQLSIISVGGTAPRELRECVLPANGHLQTVVGGTMGVLNVRLAARLLQMSADQPVDRPTLTGQLARLQKQAGLRQVPVRRPMTDAQVVAFITEHLTGRSTHSGLLRQLRDAGLACEQQRFARLFAETVRSR